MCLLAVTSRPGRKHIEIAWTRSEVVIEVGAPREDIQNARRIIGQGRLIQHLIRATRRKSAA